MVAELCSGPCLVLEIHCTDTPKSFREFCGPADPVSEITALEKLRDHCTKPVVANQVYFSKYEFLNTS